ncbi:MAG TPA: hypothetical protein VFS15_16470 [Kofleriaceae bacterium]|nr:hypothetical protein [Kofleriaceae bacterium]
MIREEEAKPEPAPAHVVARPAPEVLPAQPTRPEMQPARAPQTSRLVWLALLALLAAIAALIWWLVR